MAKKFGGSQPPQTEPPNPVAELEKELGEELIKARADYAANSEERVRLADRRKVLLAHKADVELEHRKRLIEQGRGIKGAADRRKQSDADLAEVESELSAVDAAISFEEERAETLGKTLAVMEAKLVEARRRHTQKTLADALVAKKEEFIATFVNGCILAGELVQIAERLIAIDGRPLLDQTLEDLLLRTNRLLLIDRFKFTEPQSTLGLARRAFEVTALLPPPESAATEDVA